MDAGAIVRWEGGGAGWLSPSLCRRERDEKEELPLEFSLRILLNPRMLSCSLNLLRCQFNGAASIAALLRSVKNAGWVVGEQIFLHAHKGQRGCSLSGDPRLSKSLPRKRPESKEAVVACFTALFNFLTSSLGMSRTSRLLSAAHSAGCRLRY